MKWTMKDIAAKQSWMINKENLQKLIELGLAEMREDVPYLTMAGQKLCGLERPPSRGLLPINQFGFEKAGSDRLEMWRTVVTVAKIRTTQKIPASADKTNRGSTISSTFLMPDYGAPAPESQLRRTRCGYQGGLCRGSDANREPAVGTTLVRQRLASAPVRRPVQNLPAASACNVRAGAASIWQVRGMN
jgi:hypothetical protein